MATCEDQWTYGESDIPHVVSGECQTNFFNANAMKYCDSSDGMKNDWCACYNTTIEGRCDTNPNIPGCNETLDISNTLKDNLTSEQRKQLDGMRPCWKSVCAGNRYMPDMWDENCNKSVVICNSKVDVGGSILGSNVKVNQHCNDENTEGNPLSTTIGTTDYTPGEADDKEKERKVSENIEKVFKFDEDKDKKIYEKRYIQIMLIILVIVFVSLLGLGVIVL